MTSDTLSLTSNQRIRQDMQVRDQNLTTRTKKGSQMTDWFWAEDLLDEMAERRVEITRTQTKKLWRAVFGASGLRDLPTGRGRVAHPLPNSDDVLVLDFAARSRPFEPCWVRGRVHRGAVRIVLPWWEQLKSRLLWAVPPRINTRRGLSRAA
jgi:hypothetical protein